MTDEAYPCPYCGDDAELASAVCAYLAAYQANEPRVELHEKREAMRKTLVLIVARRALRG